MSRFSNFFSSFNLPISKKSHRIFWDLGSSTSKIIINDKQAQLESSAVVLDKNLQSVIAVGDKALLYHDNLTKSMEFFFPIQERVITDTGLAKKLFSSLLSKYLSGFNILTRMEMTVAIANDISKIEKLALENVLKDLGVNKLRLCPSSEAIFKFFQNKYKLNKMCILDVGFDVSEICLYCEEKLLKCRTINLGARHFTQVTQRFMREKYNLRVSYQTSDKIKSEIARVNIPSAKNKERKIAIRGKDVLQHLIRTVTVSDQELAKYYQPLVTELVTEIKIFFDKVPAALLTEVLEKGLHLSGGGSQIAGLDKYLSQQLKCDVINSKQPQIDVVRGLTLI